MLELPPRHGKSELASKSFPAHCLGLDPTEMFISAAAAVDLARDWGKDVRNIVMSEEYQTVFPGVSLAEDSKAAGKWNTNQGGSYYAVGVGSSVLGRGANKVMIDDPFGSMEDAESEVIREKVWKWYCGTIYNRLQPGGAIVLIGHRLHQDDLHGRLIEQMKAGGDYADQWTIVRLPALAEEPSDLNDWADDPLGREPGEALWPEWFPIPALERIRRNSAFPRYWYALFQQNPIPDEGDMFTVANLGKRDHTNDVILWYRGWDLASTKKEGSPYSCGVKIGRTRDGKYVVGHVVRARGKPDVIRELILETANFDGRRVRISIPQDPGQSGVWQADSLIKDLAGYMVEATPETGEKTDRARPFAAQVNRGNVTMIDADWNAAYREELRAFPNGKYCDQVDASSRAFSALVEQDRKPIVFTKELLDAIGPPEPPRPPW